ncbi:hypothetical protein [Saccharomonospora iraqiensis]|uniref:hypothetical protein n=1 Tax=Saccharomonospora iraqiensis TaxID=52698 RepID=UPI00022E7550|nr:hypothetical protein [Saccharomonospora iraqiensis]
MAAVQREDGDARRSGLAPGSAVSFWLGNPVLNPAVLVFLALVGPWQWPLTRLLVGVALVFGVGLLVARMLPGEAPGGTAPPAVAADPRPAPRRLATALARFTVLLVPEYAVLVFAVGSLGARLHPLAAGTEGHLVPALLVAAVLGLLVVIPTGGEIPVLLAATAAGLPPAVSGVLLITLPAVSLPSMLMVGRALTWRVTGIVAACVTGAGLAAGALLTALSG